MLIDNETLRKHMHITHIDGDKINIDVDSEGIKQDIYDKVKLEFIDERVFSVRLDSMGKPLIILYTNQIFSKNDIDEIALDIQKTINNRIKSKLELK